MQNTFFDTICRLRDEEEVLLFNFLPKIPEEEEMAVLVYLETEFDRECLEYPFEPPVFDGKAALWAAKIVYSSTQLLLNRKNLPEVAEYYLPIYEEPCTISSILSADLCLRFLTEVLSQSKLIDADDEVIDLLGNHLTIWHYSGIRRQPEIPEFNLEIILKSLCLTQLYVDRIIKREASIYFENEKLRELVIASLGDYRTAFWSELIVHGK